MDEWIKGTSRGPEALQSHLNDSCYTNVLYLRQPRGFITKGRNTPLRPLDVPLSVYLDRSYNGGVSF